MSAEVVVSLASRKHIIYHRPECIYARRIKTKNKMTVEAKRVRGSSRFCPCKYCSGLAGDIRIRRDQLWKQQDPKNMAFYYNKRENVFFIRTEIGFWKIAPTDYDDNYLLFHLNHFSKDVSAESMMRWAFHRQNDVKPNPSLDSLIYYIDQHDRAKQIIRDDYRKLPRKTKKQKKYYKQAKRKECQRRARRLDSIFDAIEAEWKIDQEKNGGAFIGQAV